jgi:cold shock CspA family protein
MTIGKITKLVTSYGSTWGRIQPVGETREVFFNPETLVDPSEYAALKVDQEVEFDEEKDRANGTHAVRVRLRAAEPLAS